MSNAVTAPLLKKAMGNKLYDELRLSNDVADITVEKVGPGEYFVGGKDGDMSLHTNQYQAIGRAFEILARFKAFI